MPFIASKSIGPIIECAEKRIWGLNKIYGVMFEGDYRHDLLMGCLGEGPKVEKQRFQGVWEEQSLGKYKKKGIKRASRMQTGD